MVINRTHMDSDDLLHEATSFVSKVDTWILEQLAQLSASKRANLLNDNDKLIEFLSKTHDFIKEHTNVFVHRC